jgi:hypothetical protein
MCVSNRYHYIDGIQKYIRKFKSALLCTQNWTSSELNSNDNIYWSVSEFRYMHHHHSVNTFFKQAGNKAIKLTTGRINGGGERWKWLGTWRPAGLTALLQRHVTAPTKCKLLAAASHISASIILLDHNPHSGGGGPYQRFQVAWPPPAPSSPSSGGRIRCAAPPPSSPSDRRRCSSPLWPCPLRRSPLFPSHPSCSPAADPPNPGRSFLTLRQRPA